MNEKITLPGLTQLLALQTGDTKKQAEDFVKEFFNLISNTLASGDSVKIKDFGVFKTISVEARKSVNVSTGEEHEIPAHKKAVFVPSKEFATLVNEPFEMFETVELADDVTFDDTAVEDSFSEPQLEDMVIGSEEEDVAPAEQTPVVPVEQDPVAPAEQEPVAFAEQDPVAPAEQVSESSAPTEDEQPDSEDEDKDNVYTVEDIDEHAPASIASNTPDTPDTPNTLNLVDTEYIPEEEDTVNRKSRFGIGFLSGFIAAVLLGCVLYVCFFCVDWSQFGANKKSSSVKMATTEVIQDTVPVEDGAHGNTTVVSKTEESVNNADADKEQIAEQPANVQEKDEVPTTPSDRKVYDTISKIRYLTTMAKDHYGNYNLWPIIYEENKSFLGHPDRIRPGTQVVIPPLSKYGVDPSNPADIAKAKKKGVEIYSRYK